MHTTGIAETNPTERLTWDEIRVRHPNEWVVLVDVDWLNDDDEDFRTAIVLSHGKRRGDALREARPLLPPAAAWAHFYTGEICAPLPPLLATKAQAGE
jgi:hypothetical protein